MKMNRKLLNLIIIFLISSLFSCNKNTLEVSNQLISTTSNTEDSNSINNKYIFDTKKELFENYFKDFYYYILDKEDGKKDLESYEIYSLDDFYKFLKTYEGGDSEFPTVGTLLGKYYIRSDRGGSIYDQMTKDSFVGYTLSNNMYVEATIFFKEFFKYFRQDEGMIDKNDIDFLSTPMASIIDVNKYFYYDSKTLPYYFDQNCITRKLIDEVPYKELVDFLTATTSIAINKSKIHPNEDVYFGTGQDSNPIYKVEVKDDDEFRKNKVALTFDSGVTVEKTIQILDILDKYNIKSTFFLTYKASLEGQDMVKEILNRGHEIANHTTTHVDFRKVNTLYRKLEIFKIHDYIKKLTGIDMFLFRFPYGSYNKDCIKLLKEMGYYPIQWDIDSLDWRELGKDSIIEEVLQKHTITSGSIILFHNGAQFTPDALPTIIEEIQNRGFSFSKVSELIYYDNFKIKPMNGHQCIIE